MNEKITLPEIGKDPEHLLPDIRVYALDMDGTVYLGPHWIEGAREWLLRIPETGRKFVFLTNNSSRDPATYVERLRGMGLSVTEEQIITSGQAAIWYLSEHFAGKKVYLLGNPLLKKEFGEAGIRIVNPAQPDGDEEEPVETPDVVVTGFDTSLTYRKLCHVCDYVRAGLSYIATHPDYNCPTENGFVPDLGSISALIRASAFRDPDIVIGKPNRGISDYLMMRVGNLLPGEHITRRQVAMVGDRLYTDVAAGVNGGLTSIFVLSGEGTMENLREAAGKAAQGIREGGSEQIPDLIFRSVADIPL